MDSTTREVAHVLLPFVRVYKDGTVDRLNDPPRLLPSPSDPATGVSSKDITISPDTGVAARIYLPELTNISNNNRQKLPIVVYFHGGGFLIGSAFAGVDHHYLNVLSSQAKALAISIEYRLAPEYPLPIAYLDCWSALQWVASHSAGTGEEPWLSDHGDFTRVFIGGDSAGGNIAYNIAMRAGVEALHGGVEILGAFFSHPHFWGSKPIGSEPKVKKEQSICHKIWLFVYPSAPGGIDNPMINPFAGDAPSLSGLGCSRLLVCVAGKDELRERGVWYFDAVKRSGWEGKAEVFEVEGEDHAFHVFNFGTENSKKMVKRLAYFIRQ